MRYKNSQQEKDAGLARRRARVRAKVIGTAERPRLSASRSLVHMRAQLIDDVTGKTIAAASDLELKGKLPEVGERKGKVAKAYAVGLLLAERAKAKGVSTAVFDRSGNKYHGRIAALADGARAGGLSF